MKSRTLRAFACWQATYGVELAVLTESFTGPMSMSRAPPGLCSTSGDYRE